MPDYKMQGLRLRGEAKSIVYEYMKSEEKCQPKASGMRSASIFRECGFDWGNCENATSSNQQYWLVALMRQLESEGIVERVYKSGPWRLK